MDSRPKLDLGFKEGQTIKLSIGVSMVPLTSPCISISL